MQIKGSIYAIFGTHHMQSIVMDKLIVMDELIVLDVLVCLCFLVSDGEHMYSDIGLVCMTLIVMIVLCALY
jgi:hypothetical protein